MNCITDEQCPLIQLLENAILNGVDVHEIAAQEATSDKNS